MKRETLAAMTAAFAVVIGACAPGAAQQETRPSAAETSAAPQEGLVPAGFGTLKQDEVTLSIRSGGLLVKVTPLSEQVIRLTAPDTYTRLHNLAESRRAELAAHASGSTELFLVSFFSYQPNVEFQPEDVQLLVQGKLLRPLGMSPVTSGWGRQLLQQQESQTALYAFESPIDYDQPITLRYGLEENEAWRNLIPKLRSERNKVQSRAGGTDR